jgi:hypothetical protein
MCISETNIYSGHEKLKFSNNYLYKICELNCTTP